MWPFPFEIKEHIFKFVLKEDGHETGRVSREWFELTLRNLDVNPVDPKDPLLNDLMTVANSEAEVDSKWTWKDILDQIKYSSSVYRVGGIGFDEFYGIVLKKSTSIKFIKEDDKLAADETFRKFIEECPMFYGPFSMTKALARANAKATIGYVLECPLDLQDTRDISSLDFNWTPGFDVQNMLDFLKWQRKLKMVKFRGPRITPQWENLFPECVLSIHIEEAVVQSSIAKSTPGGVIGRSVLVFCCKQWTSVKYFKFSASKPGYGYICRPNVGNEYPTVFYSNLDSVCPQYEHLKFSRMQILLDRCPKTGQQTPPCPVDYVKVRLQGQKVPLLLNSLCEDSPELKTLSIYTAHFPALTIINFKLLDRITSLEIQGISVHCLSSILDHCKSLRDLKIKTNDSRLFSDLPKSSKNLSITTLELSQSAEDMSDILKHLPNLKKFTCLDYVHIEVSLPSIALINQLNYLHIKARKKRKLLMDLVQCNLPYKGLWYSTKKDLDCTCLFTRHVQVLRKTIVTLKPDFAYVSGFSTRFITAAGETTIEDTIDSLLMSSGLQQSRKRKLDKV